MSSFEILVATMHQKDFTKIKEMNIHSNVVFANQADIMDYSEIHFGEKTAKMITTNSRGVGLNRNIALSFSSGDILLFTDDDMLFDSNLEENVLKAFDKFKDADVMIFGINFSKNGKLIATRKATTGKLPIHKSLQYGTCSIAIKRNAVLKHRLSFSELFGGGTLYSRGEDTDFLLNCYKKGLKVYSYNYEVGTTAKDSSTCFDGYNKKYFYDTGALARFAFGVLAVPYMLYMAVKVKADMELNLKEKVKYLWKGYKAFPKLIKYEEE